jgi:uncharacterized membrane protein YbhN (UPF0104 family)
VIGGIAVLAVLVWRLGTGPFLDGVRTVDGWSLVAAAGIALVTTTSGAWRWTLVARGLGVGLPVRTAVAAYYRSQFLNTVLPGGVLGDVHRAVRHGRDVDDVGRGLRAVGWERTAGQVVQVGATLLLLLVLPSPVRPAMPLVVLVAVVGASGAVLLGLAVPHGGRSWWARTLRAVGADLRDGLWRRRSWLGVGVASAVGVAGHTATFVVAARTAGCTASLGRLVPLALLVLLASALPTNIGGWGPREGMAAWVFAAAGLTAGQGVATAVVYGVLVLVASLPGAAVLVVSWLGRTRLPARAGWARWPGPATLTRKEAARG